MDETTDSAAAPADAPTTDPFRDLAGYVALPRLSGLALSPDGSRLVTSVATLSPDGKRSVSALWAVDPAGRAPARRLTRSAPGESAPAFLPDGGLLFTSRRPDPSASDPSEDVAALWLLPADGGEARLVASRDGGITAVAVARDAGTVVVGAPTFAGTTTAEEDAQLRAARKEAGVSAILHTSVPVRFWDHDLGAEYRRLFLAGLLPDDDGAPADLRDLTPDLVRPIDDDRFVVTPDGATVITSWPVPLGPTDQHSDLVAIDTATGRRRVLASLGEAEYTAAAMSRDGSRVVCVRTDPPTVEEPWDEVLWLVDVATGEGRALAADLDRWPGSPVFGADADTVFFVADDDGARPVFRVDVPTGEVTRITRAGAYASLCVSPDGAALYALRSSYEHPAQPVRIDLTDPDAEPVVLPAPGTLAELPGRVEELRTTTADGAQIRSYLVLPRDASAERPAPLVLWIHGGPRGSWNDWSWRWCPHLLAAAGYAVLLPDPAMSTGYGRDFLRRGWGQWGGTPYTDVMAATDAALQRPDLDADRTAAMGGSYGGYLANWVAGHTDRFRAIVTHASIWALDQFQGTTDHPAGWAREFGTSDANAELYLANSPHLHADNIRTPMLLVHGDKDYRVPIGEALRLFYDLKRRDVPAQFLYFPDEGHWVLAPGNAQVWYDTVLAFLDEHVRDQPPRRPRLV